jgi:hypothetical protein
MAFGTPQARRLGPKKVMAGLIFIMKKVMATALSTAVSTKEGDGDGLEHGLSSKKAAGKD